MVPTHTGVPEMDEDLFSERMKVTDDFEVAVSPESVLYFANYRQSLPRSKRSSLYKFFVDSPICQGLYFVPEDIMKSIVDYDITPHLERTKMMRARILEVKKGHPGLQEFERKENVVFGMDSPKGNFKH